MHHDLLFQRNRPFRRAAIALSLVVAFVASVAAFPCAAAGLSLQVTQSWARATAPRAKTGAAYVTLANMNTKAERLIAASSPAAKKVEVHTSVTTDGMMSMRKLDDVTVAPGDVLVMKPGGMHLMLMGLTAPLIEGETIALVLRFESGLTREVDALVHKAGSRGPSDDHGSQHNQKTHERHMKDQDHKHHDDHDKHKSDHKK